MPAGEINTITQQEWLITPNLDIKYTRTILDISFRKKIKRNYKFEGVLDSRI